MVRDYLASLHYTDPMGFAGDYYSHYPKVALGHWPPLFYALAGPWMLIFSSSRTSVLLGLALLTTILAWLLSTAVARRFGHIAGFLAGLLLISLPLVQLYSDEVMAESLLAIVSFAAAIYFARYLETESWQDSAMFGLFASLAIMTKGNGWDLALVPPIAMVLTRRFALLTRWTFWLPAIVVVLICAPWQFLTMEMAQRGWGGGDHPSLAYTLSALREFLVVWVSLLGWGLTPLVLLGIAVTVVVPYFKKKVDPDWATMFALIPAAWIFHSIVPAGIESRKLIIAIPAMILFLCAGSLWLARRFQWKPLLVAVAIVAIFGIQKFSIPTEIHFGYTEAARFVQELPDLQRTKILVSSERDGEGMFVSELAMAEARPGHQVLRATKVLSRTDWNGHVFACFYPTPESLLAYLHQAGISIVVSDTLPPVNYFEYQRVLNDTIAKYPGQLKLAASFKGDTKGVVNVYRVN
jgi:4-amino-4-deoxy-L-arabinose transferase-like glycosyltransferase